MDTFGVQYTLQFDHKHTFMIIAMRTYYLTPVE